ncbi:MAG: transporter substrate-binding domain-containing protein [Alphaproteobacteria bacterium]|nr:transporter substrate-binding domain-containing protein [Alphaproteobacteria bacterium]
MQRTASCPVTNRKSILKSATSYTLIIELGFLLCLFAVFLSSSISSLRAENAKSEFDIYLSAIPPLVFPIEGTLSNRSAAAPSTSEASRGMLVDLAHLIFDEMEAAGFSTISQGPKILPWQRATRDLEQRPNTAMLQMARSPAREDKYIWIQPTDSLSFAFISVSQPQVNSLAEALKYNRVAVYKGSRLEDFLRSKNFSDNLVLANDSDTSARMLDRGRVDIWYASVKEALWLHKAGKIKRELVVGNAISEVPVWAVMSKNSSPQAVEAFSSALKQIFADNRYMEIHQNYGVMSH